MVKGIAIEDPAFRQFPAHDEYLDGFFDAFYMCRGERLDLKAGIDAMDDLRCQGHFTCSGKTHQSGGNIDSIADDTILVAFSGTYDSGIYIAVIDAKLDPYAIVAEFGDLGGTEEGTLNVVRMDEWDAKADEDQIALFGVVDFVDYSVVIVNQPLDLDIDRLVGIEIDVGISLCTQMNKDQGSITQFRGAWVLHQFPSNRPGQKIGGIEQDGRIIHPGCFARRRQILKTKLCEIIQDLPIAGITT